MDPSHDPSDPQSIERSKQLCIGNGGFITGDPQSCRWVDNQCLDKPKCCDKEIEEEPDPDDPASCSHTDCVMAQPEMSEKATQDEFRGFNN